MTSVDQIDGQQIVAGPHDLSVQDQKEMESKTEIGEVGIGDHGGVCAICLDKIVLQETAFVIGCDHSYCVTCILRWATYNQKPTCPQCKHPLEYLSVHRSLDGSIHDFLLDESVCLLLRASWFKPLVVEDQQQAYDDAEECYNLYDYDYEEDHNDSDEVFFRNSTSIRIGNRRWGDSGYVRAGRQEATPVRRPNSQSSGAGSSREPNNKEVAKNIMGRRAKRALKREAAEKAAAAKHPE